MTRRRTAAFAALAAVTGVLVFGGVTAANADAVIDITAPGDGAQVLWTPTPLVISGTTTDTDYFDTIDVYDWGSGSAVELCTGIDPTPGTWSCAASLDPGYHDIRVTQGTLPNTDTMTFTVTPPEPTRDQPADYTVPYGVPVTFSGTVQWTAPPGTPPGYQNYVSVDIVERAIGCADSDVSDGTWSCDVDLADDPLEGDYTVNIQQNVTGGSTSTINSSILRVGGPPVSTITIDSPAAAPDPFLYTWDAGTFATVSGRAPVGDPVDVLLDGAPAWTACQGLTVNPAGEWNCGSVNISIGQHSIIAQQLVGTIYETDTRNIDVQAPAPDVNGLPLTAEEGAFFPISGTNAVTGYTVTASVTDGEEYEECSDPAPVDGVWSCYLDLTGFSAGAYTLTVEQRPNPENASIHSIPADHPFTVTVHDAGTPPPLTCSFTPGGATISSSMAVIEKGVYRLTPYDDGGKKGSGYSLTNQGYCNGDPGYVTDPDLEWDFELIQDCNLGACSLSGLAPGLYEVWYGVDGESDPEGYSTESFDYVFRVPETPVISTVASTASSILARGTGTPGDLVRVVRPAGTTLCSVTVTGSGNWACSFPKSTTTSARAIAVDPSSGGISARSAARNFPQIVVEPADPPLNLVAWVLEFGGDLSNLKPGDKFTLNVSGMPVGTEIEVWIHSTPQLLGTATGTGLPMALNLQVPMDIESGDHEIEMIAVTPLGTNYFFTSDATVLGGAEPTKPLDAIPDDETEVAAGGGGGSGSHNDPGGPSGISGTIAPLQAVFDNPTAIAIAGGLALALLFLVALPTELLNSSLSSNTTRLGRVYGTVDRAMTRAQDWLIKVTHSRALVAVLLVVVVAVVYGFVDPAFGFNIVSLRLVLSLAIAFFLLSFVASALSRVVIQRLWGAMAVVAIQPSIIIFAIIGVIVARILDFSPGFLVGVAIGLELIQASKRVAARAVFVQIAFVVGLSLAAWIVYSLFTPGNDFFGMLLEDTMVATTAEGLTGALIAVFPLKFLDGRELWEVSKRLWAAAFLIVATAFALLVLPTAIAGTNVADYATWLIVFAVFGGVSFAVWLIFVRADRRATPAEKPKVDA